MPESIKVWLDEQIGISGQYLWLRKADGTLLNTGGDALTESPASSGQFSATLAESRTGLGPLRATITGSNDPADAVAAGWLAESSLLVVDEYPQAGGSGGLTTEQEGTLNTIYSQTSQITGSRINTIGPVSAAGDITLIAGKDYKVASESELTISVPDAGGALYAEFTNATLASSKAFGMSRTNGDADIAGTVYSVAYASNVTTFKVEIDADQLPDTLSRTDDWTYQIERVTSGGDKVVGVQGAGTVAMRAV